uniref:Uncharacterized protein n=1 Tax=Zea mays TaxID=4577 RepID=B6SJI5_MAIZE|nr:hypothetical protein [Zea mays]
MSPRLHLQSPAPRSGGGASSVSFVTVRARRTLPRPSPPRRLTVIGCIRSRQLTTPLVKLRRLLSICAAHRLVRCRCRRAPRPRAPLPGVLSAC